MDCKLVTARLIFCFIRGLGLCHQWRASTRFNELRPPSRRNPGIREIPPFRFKSLVSLVQILHIRHSKYCSSPFEKIAESSQSDAMRILAFLLFLLTMPPCAVAFNDVVRYWLNHAVLRNEKDPKGVEESVQNFIRNLRNEVK